MIIVFSTFRFRPVTRGKRDEFFRSLFLGLYCSWSNRRVEVAAWLVRKQYLIKNRSQFFTLKFNWSVNFECHKLQPIIYTGLIGLIYNLLTLRVFTAEVRSFKQMHNKYVIKDWFSTWNRSLGQKFATILRQRNGTLSERFDNLFHLTVKVKLKRWKFSNNDRVEGQQIGSRLLIG